MSNDGERRRCSTCGISVLVCLLAGTFLLVIEIYVYVAQKRLLLPDRDAEGAAHASGQETRKHGIGAGDILPATVERGTLCVRFEPHSTDADIDAEVALAVSTIGDSLAFTISSGLRWKYALTGGESMCTRPLEDGNGIAYPLADACEK